MTSWDYVQSRMAEQQEDAARHRLIAAARPRRGVADRVTTFVRTKTGRSARGGCQN
jgi:hypothetical protein